MPETSRSFYYWQPAPRWRLLPWLANPGNPAMSPRTEGEKTGTLHTDKTEGQGSGDSLQGVPRLSENANAQKKR